MKANVGSYDAGVRFILGCAILFCSMKGLGWWGLLGLIPIITGACSFCPLYALLRVNTYRWEKEYEARHGRGTNDGATLRVKNPIYGSARVD